MKPLEAWQICGPHIWYFAEADRIVAVDSNQHWYWEWFCRPHKKASIYLGEL